MPMSCCSNSPLVVPGVSRRQMLRRAGFGFGAWALLDLLTRDGAFASVVSNPLSAKPAQFLPRAKHAIFLFMQGGPSHLDTFDPKPMLNRYHGQPLPASITQGITLQFTHMDASVLGCPQTFSKCGTSGLEIADTYPHLQRCADDLC